MLNESTSNALEYKKLYKEEMESRGILGRLIGVCASFDAPTRNGRKYSEKLWENVFDDPIMKERIENGVCYGELGHPADREETDMEKIAVCLAEVPKKGTDGKLRAVFDILNTPNGRILKSLCDYGSTLGISSRGSGDLEVDYGGQESVNPDTYNCEGFDIVLIPGVKEARLEYVTESLDKKRYNKTLRQKLTESINKETEDHQKIMKESLNTLGIDLNEDKSEKFIITKIGTNTYALAKGNPPIVNNRKKIEANSYEEAKEILINNGYSEDELMIESLDNLGIDLKYDDTTANAFKDEFDIASPQEVANIFNKTVETSDGTLIKPDVNEAWTDTDDIVYGMFNGEPEGQEKVYVDTLTDEVKKIYDFSSVTCGNIIDSDDHNKSLDCIKAFDVQLSDDELNNIIDKISNMLATKFNATNIKCWQKYNQPRGDRKSDDKYITGLNFNYQIDDTLTEAKFGGYSYTYGVHAIGFDGRDRILAGAKTEEEVVKLAIEQAQKVFENPFMNSNEKYRYIDDMYISNDDTEQLVEPARFDDYIDGLLGELRSKKDFKESANIKDSKLTSHNTQSGTFVKDKKGNIVVETPTDDEATEFMKDQKINEGAYTKDELWNKFGTTDLDIINAGNEETVTLLDDDSKQDESLDIDESSMAGDYDTALVDELQEALKLNKSLDEKIVSLQKQLSASNAQEMKLHEEIDNLKIKIVKLSDKAKTNNALTEKLSKLEKELEETTQTALNKKTALRETIERDAKDREVLRESIESRDNKIAAMQKQLAELKDKTFASNKNVNALNEQLETAQKDARQIKEKYSKKLEEKDVIIEKYKKIAKTAVDNYINSRATTLGISPNEIKNRLPESYSFKDINDVCDDLREYNINMNSLPFSTNKLNESVNVSVKNIDNRVLVNNPDDDISETDIKLAERFMR